MSRFGPGVYTRDMANANLASSLSGFNITAVIGLGKNWKLISDIEIVKSQPVANVAGENEILYENVINTFIGEKLLSYTTYVLHITSSNEGYYKVDSSIEGALEVISNDSTIVKDNQIKIKDVTPWQESEAVVIGDYVILCNNGDYLERDKNTSGVSLVVPTLNSRDIIDIDFDKLLNIVSIGTLPGLNQFTLNINYIISKHEGDEQDVDNGKAEIIWLDGAQPTTGSSFYVTYKQYKNSEDYEPKYKYSTESIVAEYGAEYDNGVVNSLTLAANLVIEGQTVYGGGVLCCQVKNNDLTGWKEAIDKLDKKVFNTYILTNQDEQIGQQLQAYLKNKIETLSSITYKAEKTAFFVPPFKEWDIMTIGEYRQSLNYDRITLFGNKTCTIELVDNTTLETVFIELSSIYACANVSGIEGNPEYTFSEPMLRKKLSTRITFNEEQRYNPSEMFTLDNNGVSIFDMDLLSNISYVYVIGTTDMTNVMTETRAVRRETDLLRQNVRKNLDQYIGQKNKPITASSATETTKAMLRNFINIDEIADFRDVTSWFDEQEPRLLRQSFWYMPYLEVRWIFVDIGTYI